MIMGIHKCRMAAIEEKEYDKQVKKLGKLSFGVIHKEEEKIIGKVL